MQVGCVAFAVIVGTIVVPAGAELAGKASLLMATVLLRHAEALSAAYHEYVKIWKKGVFCRWQKN